MLSSRESIHTDRHRSCLVEEAPLLEPSSLLGRDLDVSGGSVDTLSATRWMRPSSPTCARGEIDQALGRLRLHGLKVHDRRDVGLELLTILAASFEPERLDEMSLASEPPDGIRSITACVSSIGGARRNSAGCRSSSSRTRWIGARSAGDRPAAWTTSASSSSSFSSTSPDHRDELLLGCADRLTFTSHFAVWTNCTERLRRPPFGTPGRYPRCSPQKSNVPPKQLPCSVSSRS